MNLCNTKHLQEPIMALLKQAGELGVRQRELIDSLRASDKTVRKYADELMLAGRAERLAVGTDVVWFAAGMSAGFSEELHRSAKKPRKPRAPRKAGHDITRHTRSTERAPNISAPRLAIETALKTGAAYTAADMARLAGITPTQARNMVAKLQHQGLVRRATDYAGDGVAYVWAATCGRTTAERPPTMAAPRTHVNAAMPTGTPSYWAQMMR